MFAFQRLTQDQLCGLLDPDTIINTIAYSDNVHVTPDNWNVGKIIMFFYSVKTIEGIKEGWRSGYITACETRGISTLGGDDYDVIVQTLDYDYIDLYNKVLTLVEDITQQSIEDFTRGNFHYLDIEECKKYMDEKFR